jgi:hypothetical protein
MRCRSNGSHAGANHRTWVVGRIKLLINYDEQGRVRCHSRCSVLSHNAPRECVQGTGEKNYSGAAPATSGTISDNAGGKRAVVLYTESPDEQPISSSALSGTNPAVRCYDLAGINLSGLCPICPEVMKKRSAHQEKLLESGQPLGDLLVDTRKLPDLRRLANIFRGAVEFITPAPRYMPFHNMANPVSQDAVQIVWQCYPVSECVWNMLRTVCGHSVIPRDTRLLRNVHTPTTLCARIFGTAAWKAQDGQFTPDVRQFYVDKGVVGAEEDLSRPSPYLLDAASHEARREAERGTAPSAEAYAKQAEALRKDLERASKEAKHLRGEIDQLRGDLQSSADKVSARDRTIAELRATVAAQKGIIDQQSGVIAIGGAGGASRAGPPNQTAVMPRPCAPSTAIAARRDTMPPATDLLSTLPRQSIPAQHEAPVSREPVRAKLNSRA